MLVGIQDFIYEEQLFMMAAFFLFNNESIGFKLINKKKILLLEER